MNTSLLAIFTIMRIRQTGYRGSDELPYEPLRGEFECNLALERSSSHLLDDGMTEAVALRRTSLGAAALAPAHPELT